MDLKEACRRWWEDTPMVYDWEHERSDAEDRPEFFRALDARFRNVSWFAHDPGEPMFSRYIPYGEIEGKRVLVVGCGAGTVAGELSRSGARVTAIDLTERALGLTRKRFRMFGLEGGLCRTDAESLPFDEGTFDFVWSWGVIHHSPNTETSAREIHRVLKEGGRTVVMVYNRNSISYWIFTVLVRGILGLKLLTRSLEEHVNESYDGFIARHFTPEEARRLFPDFDEVRVEVQGQRSEALPKLHRLIEGDDHPVDSFVNLLTSRWGHFAIVRAEK